MRTLIVQRLTVVFTYNSYPFFLLSFNLSFCSLVYRSFLSSCNIITTQKDRS